MNNFLKGFHDLTNINVTDNGALAHKTTNSALVDFFAQAGAMRNRSEKDILTLFFKAYNEDKLTALKLLFYVRDIRGGLGERKIFRMIINYLAITKSTIVIKNLENIVEMGRWDDLFVLLDTPCQPSMVNLIQSQLELDKISISPSLLAKWMKSINTSSDESVAMAYRFANLLKLSAREYRKLLSSIRKKINIVETQLSNKEFTNIDYKRVPSNANLKYHKAFWRNDELGYRKYMEQVESGEVKINAKTLYPYEIVKQCLQMCGQAWGAYDNAHTSLTLNNLWNNLPDYVGDDYSNTMAIIDTSGSMTCNAYTPLASAIALGIYFAERNKGMFANHYISFSHKPELIKIVGDNIYDKTKEVYDTDLIADTDIEKVFDLILQTAIDNKLSQAELPSRLVIISDMQFNFAVTSNIKNTDTLFKNIRAKWSLTDYTVPNLVFWNVDAKSEVFPMTIDDAGVQFVSGHSPVIFESILKNEFINPMDLLLSVVNNPRYDVITI